MTAPNPQAELPDFDAQRLRQLAAAQCDECLTDAESQELESLLAASAAAREMYVRFMNVHAGLEWEITSHESVEGIVPASQTNWHSSRRPTRRAYAAWVAAVGAAILAGVWFNSGSWNVDEAGTVRPVATVGAGPGPDALPQSNSRVEWTVARRQDATPNKLEEGDVVCVTEGHLQVTFDCGAVVTLYAPAMMEVISPIKGRAIRGKLAAHVVEGAEGFTIETPQATVVDLGTVFGVEVSDDGQTDVVVFKGAVDLHFEPRDESEPQHAPHRLTSGEAMRIDKRGTASRIVSISSDRFANRPDFNAPPLDRAVLISSVSDNINRDAGSWNYYEIVPGGMQEDAKAFVDRDQHEWNGIDAEGMPKFLLGGDYVKMFNNDKFGREIELFLTIDQPCRLYVLWDDRIPPPAWLLERFHDTNADIGMDVGPFYRLWDGKRMEDRLPGVGPGISVDDVMSVWECEIAAPEVVHLGATEAAHRFVNMYGLVAVPLKGD